MQVRRWMLTLAAAAGLGVSASAFADIKGTVSFEGNAPEPEQIDMSAVKECAMQHPDGAFDESLVVADGKLANVIISVKDAPAGGKARTETAFLDQKGCQYKPHVLAVQVGQPIKVRNDDPFLHNVHSLAIDNPAFNFGQPNVDQGKPVDPMKVAERFKIKCDVHPWMGAHISVFEHPYFAASKEDGTFTIPGNLPDGEVTLVAWHEKLGEQEFKVTVAGGKAENANVTFKAAGADAGKQLNSPAEVKLASFEAKAATTKECCGNCPASKAQAIKAVADAKKAPAEQPQASAK